jgi:hypothetical protein
MTSASAKPLFVTNNVFAPDRSRRALVATVEPTRIDDTRSAGKGAPGSTFNIWRMATTVASASPTPRDGNFRARSRPSGVLPMTSVNVPPRSTQNVQPADSEVVKEGIRNFDLHRLFSDASPVDDETGRDNLKDCPQLRE